MDLSLRQTALLAASAALTPRLHKLHCQYGAPYCRRPSLLQAGPGGLRRLPLRGGRKVGPPSQISSLVPAQARCETPSLLQTTTFSTSKDASLSEGAAEGAREGERPKKEPGPPPRKKLGEIVFRLALAVVVGFSPALLACSDAPRALLGEAAFSNLEMSLRLGLGRAEATLAQLWGGAAGLLEEAPELTEEEGAAAAAAARELVDEVWGVVAQEFLDARGEGRWSAAAWDSLHERTLAQNPRDLAAARRAIREMLAYGVNDPYTRLVSPEDFAAMSKYDITGVGLNLSGPREFERKTGLPLQEGRENAQDGVWVLGITKGSIAERAGIRQGYEIVSVDGAPAQALNPFQVASLIQGEAGGPGEAAPPRDVLDLEVRRRDGALEWVTLTRPQPQGESRSPVRASLEDRGGRRVGVIELSGFSARAQPDVAAAIRRLEGDGAQSLVLDLRNNHGGLVTEGVEVAKLFLDDGSPIVTTAYRNSDLGVAEQATGPPLTRKPLTVLVNQYTASASEIMAGALHDNCRAALVGQRTFGKGIIQAVYALSDESGLIVTVGKYVTPAGTDIDREGIRPDFSRSPAPAAYNEAIKACQIRRGLA